MAEAHGVSRNGRACLSDAPESGFGDCNSFASMPMTAGTFLAKDVQEPPIRLSRKWLIKFKWNDYIPPMCSFSIVFLEMLPFSGVNE